MQFYIEQDTVSSLVINNDCLIDGYDFYLLKLTSVVTQEEYTVIPQISSTNNRYVELAIHVTSISSEEDRLDGIVYMYLPGTYVLDIYRTDTESLTPDNQSLLVKVYCTLTCTNQEVPTTVYSTPNNSNVYHIPE